MSLAALSELPGVVLGKDLPGAIGSSGSAPSTLSLGFPAFEQILPAHGLPEGQITELTGASSLLTSTASVALSSNLSTTLALRACKEAQAKAALHGGDTWCAFVDPQGTLYAPGARRAGVNLSRLLVLRPPLEAITRVAIKLAETRAFSVIVIDLGSNITGAKRSKESCSERHWVKAVRRMALAIEHTKSVVLLLTNEALNLPVGLRLNLVRHEQSEFLVSVTKEKQGRLTEARRVQLSSSSIAGEMESAAQGKVLRLERVAGPARERKYSSGFGHPRNVRPRFDARLSLPLFGAP